MPSSIDDYRRLVERPWGKMFYEIIYTQLNLPTDKKLEILDYGAGFCVTADHYAKDHNVTAVEPNIEMSKHRFQKNRYQFLTGDIGTLRTMDSDHYDVVICHNVLEYADDKEEIFKELIRVMKPEGKLSVVKHNMTGRILAAAVFDDNPESALRLLKREQNTGENFLGNRNVYDNDFLLQIAGNYNLNCDHIYGIRTLFALSKNDEIKYSEKWYRDMLRLELDVCDLDEYKNISYFHHLIFTKSQPHKRRVRYRGTHPRKYSEKYKELNPEKYADTVEKVIRKGSTPAGMHISIMVHEILEFLQIRPGQQGLDATLGYGGHTKKMLECLEGKGHIYALDVDPIESEKTKRRLEKEGFGTDILTVKQMNFADIDQVAEEAGLFDFVLADLGVSSMQIDNPERGFSYKNEGPLDLRLNPEKGVPASERLKGLSREEFEGMLVENADEPYAVEIAKAVMAELKKGKDIDTTAKLRQIIEKTLEFVPEKERKDAVKKCCQRVFQAIRIDVNSEFEVLESFLEKLPSVLAPGGRAAILTFHSGEDRMVKKSFKQYAKQGVYSQVAKDVIRPSAEECRQNGRARSTKMRWAVKAE